MRARNEQFAYAARKAAKSEYLKARWEVFRDFEIERETEHDVVVYAPRHSPELPKPEKPGESQEVPVELLFQDHNLERVYAPLQDEPSLFLKFAALARPDPVSRDEALSIMLDWAKTYGVLGLHGVDTPEGPHSFGRRERRRESLWNFVHAVRQAAWCLSLYEAATAPGGPDINTLERQGVDGKMLKDKRKRALELVRDHVGEQLKRECYPQLYQETLTKTDETIGFAQGWGFRSLLGAMYLQMAWLMSEGSNAPRCKGPGCYKIIRIGEFEKPQQDPGLSKGARVPYRTRKDKTFCGRNCKQKWRYHYIIKPKRQNGAAGGVSG
jgi:hypothetical protein